MTAANPLKNMLKNKQSQKVLFFRYVPISVLSNPGISTTLHLLSPQMWFQQLHTKCSAPVRLSFVVA